jgi:hypothetical protein
MENGEWIFFFIFRMILSQNAKKQHSILNSQKTNIFFQKNTINLQKIRNIYL